MSGPRKGERGQAMVETALTMPLALFLILGGIQLFLMMQGRAMAQYAAARATRAGSLKHGDCRAMVHTAVAALLPTFARTPDAASLAEEFRVRRDGRYVPARDHGHSEPIVWIIRHGPDVDPNDEELFDLARREPRTLRVQLVFWYPMRIPFANWVISSISLAHWNLRNHAGANPLMMTQTGVDWRGDGVLDGAIAQELLRRADRRHYVMPIVVTYTMRMMTPARPEHFTAPTCPPLS